MARTTCSAAFLVAAYLVFVPVISAYHYHATTADQDQHHHHCRDQMQRHSLSYCKHFLSQGREYIILQTRLGMDRPEQQLQECCGQLRQFDERCRCKGLKHIVQEQARKGGLPREEVHEVVTKAENLPEMCRLSSSRCQIWSGGYQ